MGRGRSRRGGATTRERGESGEGAGAGGTGAGGATVAVVGGADGGVPEGVEVEVPEVEGVAVFSGGDGEVEHLVEVAVEDPAFPGDIDGVPAHETVDGGGVECVLEGLEVVGVVVVVFEVRRKAGDGHVGDGEEGIEVDAEVGLHFAFVFGFEFLLVAGKESTVGVVDEVEDELGVASVAEGIEFLEGADGGIEDAFAALGVDVLGLITGHGGDDFDLVFGEEVGSPFVSRFVDNGGVEPVHDASGIVPRAHGGDEAAEVGRHFGGAAGEVEDGDLRGFEPGEDAVDGGSGDEFFAIGAGVYVAVGAGEVAAFAEVELEDFGLGAGEGEGGEGGELLVEGRHGGRRWELDTGRSGNGEAGFNH